MVHCISNTYIYSLLCIMQTSIWQSCTLRNEHSQLLDFILTGIDSPSPSHEHASDFKCRFYHHINRYIHILKYKKNHSMLELIRVGALKIGQSFIFLGFTYS